MEVGFSRIGLRFGLEVGVSLFLRMQKYCWSLLCTPPRFPPSKVNKAEPCVSQATLLCTCTSRQSSVT